MHLVTVIFRLLSIHFNSICLCKCHIICPITSVCIKNVQVRSLRLFRWVALEKRLQCTFWINSESRKFLGGLNIQLAIHIWISLMCS